MSPKTLAVPSSLVFALLASSALGLGGCAEDAALGDDESAVTEEELGAFTAAVVGSYSPARFGQPPTFDKLELRADGTFYASIDTGIRCIKAPCPSQATLDGKYTAYKKTLRLRTYEGDASGDWYGSYGYTVAAGGALTLTRSDLPGWSAALTRAPGIWDAASQTLTAKSAGGGFVPMAPEGSTCTWGQETYAYTRATRLVTWKACEPTSKGGPLAFVEGSRTVSPAVAARIELGALGVSVTEEEICGADKPALTVEVGSAAGTKVYTDAFYACLGGGKTYVANIDGVFGALRDAAR